MLGVAAIALIFAARAHYLRVHGPVPLDRSMYLRDVTEPITIIKGLSFSDGGSLGISFQDARGVTKDVCLESLAFSPDAEISSEPYGCVVMNSFVPSRDGRVLVSGDDERALLGLLERWAKTNVAPNSDESVALAILAKLRRRN
jgi:hypothetical protein